MPPFSTCHARVPPKIWGFDEFGVMRDSTSRDELVVPFITTAKEVRPHHRSQLDLALQDAIRLFVRAMIFYLIGQHAQPRLCSHSRELGSSSPWHCDSHYPQMDEIRVREDSVPFDVNVEGLSR